jgi:hypothetical protein
MSSLDKRTIVTTPSPAGLPAIQLPLKINTTKINTAAANTLMPNNLTKDSFTQQMMMNPRGMGGNQRSCLASLLEMFSWGAMFSLSDSLMDSLLRVLGHVFGNLGDVLGSIF